MKKNSCEKPYALITVIILVSLIFALSCYLSHLVQLS
jgi:hypothetical protein